jgi:hypothetical protein
MFGGANCVGVMDCELPILAIIANVDMRSIIAIVVQPNKKDNLAMEYESNK